MNFETFKRFSLAEKVDEIDTFLFELDNPQSIGFERWQVNEIRLNLAGLSRALKCEEIKED